MNPISANLSHQTPLPGVVTPDTTSRRAYGPLAPQESHPCDSPRAATGNHLHPTPKPPPAPTNHKLAT